MSTYDRMLHRKRKREIFYFSSSPTILRKQSFGLFVKSARKPIEILFKLNKMTGYTPDEETNLYEAPAKKDVLVVMSPTQMKP
ncbi:uncharacterized protein LOC120217698 isoform X2 [Hibiscus syriacus]|uniref:uncharacterized protein LOC120217698 isoform X2 n=1 Tax=Hibiscus syriacus TaxID=106335 RepID=UPI001921CD4B|nr:uncharacterized protein LOC120217698 isoform X2 [Hibiscus syriacus]